MEHLLNSLIVYSNLILIILNLILVIITGVYAYLTWKMVREMKVARENQSDSNLIAFPVTMGQVYAQIQLENAGPGIALDIELTISLDPPLKKDAKIWKHPALLVGQKELFLLPYEEGNGGLESLKQLSEKHNNLVLKLKWNNIFGYTKVFNVTYKLSDLTLGWYNAGHLIKPDDMPMQMQKVTKSLDEIHKDIEGISRDQRLKPIIEELNKTNIKKHKTSHKKKVTK